MLNPLQIRLSDADREEYGGDEWLDFNPALFLDVRSNVLAGWEKQTGVKILPLLAGDLDLKDVEVLTSMPWYARQLAGLTTPAYRDFHPHVLAMEMRATSAAPEGDDADPPARSSAETSAETPKARRSQPGSKR